MTTPVFFVREIPIYGDLILSPMAGFSDKPFRAICRELGSAMSYTEFVSADGLAHNNRKSWQYFTYAEAERPIAFQLFDHEIDRLVTQCQRVVDRLHPDTIDINMGCR
jgi:tRNA-dihydrouridine synthase